MLNLIKYNPTLLRTRALELRKYAAEHDDAIDRVTNLVNGLPEIWEGKSEEKFVAAFQEMSGSFQQFGSVMESYAQELETRADQIEAAEQRIKNKVNAVG